MYFTYQPVAGVVGQFDPFFGGTKTHCDQDRAKNFFLHGGTGGIDVGDQGGRDLKVKSKKSRCVSLGHTRRLHIKEQDQTTCLDQHAK